MRSKASILQPEDEFVEALVEFLINNYAKLSKTENAKEELVSRRHAVSVDQTETEKCDTLQSM
ncbi:MAG: hypothetical protein JRJ26_20035 [Deltaproteobacteria bacterium]|nr:hypothetical protein [Deltaproteobacteria bacterium]